MFEHCRRVACAALLAAGVFGSPSARADDVKSLAQGFGWTDDARNDFYTYDQGAQMIPLAWFRALKGADGRPFLADELSRYGYLPNPSNPTGLPVGFTTADTPQGQMAGMTCSACHTRQIDVAGTSYRIDGGPAIADFETFLGDLDQAMLGVLKDDAGFATFATAVLGQHPSDADVAVLRADATVWSARFHILMAQALPTRRRWGPARLDAVSMIFNRVTGLDLGPAPTYLMPENIVMADAPARYPFLWNAPRQACTQWPGFAQNGTEFFALSRNLGQVYGVFGTFHPRETRGSIVTLFNRNYILDNSANFPNLAKLEDLVKRIEPPKWQWPVDASLLPRGETIFNRPNASDGTGGCVDCHGVKTGFPDFYLWKTPIQKVGTDVRETRILTRYAASGTMKDASIPIAVPNPILETDLAITILKASVVGAIGEYDASKIGGGLGASSRLGALFPGAASFAPMTSIAPMTMAPMAAAPLPAAPLPAAPMSAAPMSAAPMSAAPMPTTPMSVVAGAGQLADVATSVIAAQAATTPLVQMDAAFRVPGQQAAAGTSLLNECVPAEGAYESRVLRGIWAAAPYLHNGSVPTLADLLLPAEQRRKDFAVGPAYDVGKVGLAETQTKTTFVLHTTGCGTDAIASGDSNCGHEYGTRLPDDDKKALLEYLKTL